MKKKILLALATVAAAVSGFARDPGSFFRDADLILTGTYYYPEHWPEEQWERDIKNIADMGFTFTHYGEFAWAAMEPEEGRYEFGWLDKAVALAEKYGLKVILCTPTATPPAWLTAEHPDLLYVTGSGQRVQHGGRQHASWASGTYRKYVEKILTRLAERYGHHPAVMGWQIDNEPSHYTFSYEYSDNNTEKFRQWLSRKYGGDIDKLNDAWGATFWSQMYNDFRQIEIPNPSRLPAKANPHAMLDFKRFTADLAADFVNSQSEMLRSRISPEQWITTNTMPGHPQVDPSRMDRLDFVTYTRYVVNGRYQGIGDRGFRISRPELLGWNNDFYRNIKGITGVMEIQPGQINAGKFNPQPYPGAVRLWHYHIFAGGNRLVCHYRFRQPLVGCEQYHYGTMQTDGVSLSRTGREIVRFNEEMKKIREAYDPEARRPQRLERLRTAIVINPDNRWETNFQPQTEQWSTSKHYDKIYSVLKSLGAPVDVVEESADLCRWPVVVAPAYQLLDKELVRRWEEYVRQGGHLVLTCRTGQKDRNGHLWEDKLSGPIYRLIGAEELYYDHLPGDQWASVEMDGQRYRWNNWGEVIAADGTSEVWASHSDQFYSGMAAVLNKRIGKGQVTYIGIDTDSGRLERDVMRKVYAGKGEVFDLPEGVILEWRDGFWIGLNFGIAKLAAIDPRLVNVDAQDEPGSKTNRAIGEITRTLDETDEYNGTVAIFCDNYRNQLNGKEVFNLFEDIKQKLIATGIPSSQIVIMQPGMSDVKKTKIFNAVNSGEIRVILGSTATLGTGVNIQERLHTVIHMDAPNRPMDYTQRNGRILRQGNLHKQWELPVRILRFGVEDSLDVTAYQRLKTKSGFIDAIMDGKRLLENNQENRTLEEEEEGLFDNPVAALSGSQYALLKQQAEREARKYRNKKAQYDADQIYIHNTLRQHAGQTNAAIKEIAEHESRLDKIRSMFPDGKARIVTIEGRKCSTEADVDAALRELVNKPLNVRTEEARKDARFTDESVNIHISLDDMPVVAKVLITREAGYDEKLKAVRVVMHKDISYSVPALDIFDEPVMGAYVGGVLDVLSNEIISGKEDTEFIEALQLANERRAAEDVSMKQREGKPFAFDKELREAEAKVTEYTELMKAELAEKEAKYAERGTSENVDIARFSSDDVEADDNKYRLREEEPPVNTGIGYKVFVLKDSKLYPPMVANPNGEETPTGVWLNADAAPVAATSKTGRAQVKAGGKGTQGGSGKLAYRPGWHLGVIPYAIQFNRLNPATGERELFPANFVWAEVEYANDVDFQEEAMSYGYNQNGKFQHSYAGLPRVPENGAYTYRTVSIR